MEYVQMTLTDWLEMKKKLEADLTGVTASFIRIGYTLRRIEDERLYERDGYSSVAEFARKEYGLSASTVSRFMAINKRYSIGGYSEKLAPEYAGLGSSKLSEMLALPDSDLSMITPETPRDTIRELKDFNKQEQEGTTDLDEFLMNFFESRVKEWKNAEINEKGLKEALNPSGTRVYRKGKYFMAFYDADIKIKKFGSEPESLTWDELKKWMQNHLTELVEIVREEEGNAEPEEQSQEEEKEAVAPAQKPGKSAERLNKTPDPEEEEQGQEEEKPKDPETAEKEEIAPAQKVEKPAEILDTKPDLAENMNPPEETEAAAAEEPEKTAETLDKEPVSGEVVDREDELENLIGRLKESVEKRHWNLALFTAEKIVKRLGEKV